MTNLEFEQLVARLSVEERESPRLYRVKLLVLVSFGYFVMLSIVLGVASAALVVIFGIAATPIGWGILILLVQLSSDGVEKYIRLLSTLLVRVEPPRGLALTRAHAPGLFACIEEVRAELKIPTIHQVLLTREVNASVTSVPRALLLGNKRYLSVGLPLLDALNPQQARAVIAHELGHLARADGRFGAWLYAVATSWGYLEEHVRGKPGGRAVDWFLVRYMPRFNAYSSVLRRAREFEADAFAARLCGAQVAGSTLVELRLRAEQLGAALLDQLKERANQEPEPPGGLYFEARALLHQPLGDEADTWLAEALAEAPDALSTHPVLSARLAALGAEPIRMDAGDVRASHSMLAPECLDPLTSHFSQEWLSANAAAWMAQYQERQADEERLKALDDQAAQGELELEAALERGRLVLHLRGTDEAEGLFGAAVGRWRDSKQAWFNLGLLLLRFRNDANAIPMLEYAAGHCPATAMLSYRALAEWYVTHDDDSGLNQARERYEQAYAAMAYAEAERQCWLLADTLHAAEFKREDCARIRRIIDYFPQLSEAYLVAKDVHFYPEHPVHVIAIVGAGYYLDQHVANAIRQDMPDLDDWFVVWAQPDDGRLVSARQVPGASLR